MDKNNEYRLTIRIEKELRDKFQTICKENGLMGSRVIRNFVIKFVEKHEQMKDN